MHINASQAFCEAFHKALDGIEADKELNAKTAVVTLSTHPRIFSNGMDIENFTEEKEAIKGLEDFQKLVARVLTFRHPTVALRSLLEQSNLYRWQW